MSKGQAAVDEHLERVMSPNRWKLDCLHVNPAHCVFRIFDPHGANCGQVTLNCADVPDFISDVWRGSVNWNGKFI